MKPGEEIAVSNGIDGREYRCGIETFTENEPDMAAKALSKESETGGNTYGLFKGAF